MYEIIKQLEEDHQQIITVLDEFEDKLLLLMEESIFHQEDYTNVISFIREFADKAHHQREEQILFAYLTKHGGKVAENLVRQGMLVEHDYARFYVKELERAVDSYAKNNTAMDKLAILSYGKSYIELLRKHIEKENKVVYPFAQRVLSEELFVKMEVENEQFQTT